MHSSFKPAAWLTPTFLLALVASIAPNAWADEHAHTAADKFPPNQGNVIFFHPDGTSAGNWAIARALYHGPDGELNWDRLPHMAIYTGHMFDSLTATSNGGATSHAYGVKVYSGGYGMMGREQYAKPIVDAEGHSLSIGKQAIRAGLPVGLVQSGTSTEPGTGCFLASVPRREMHEEIALQLVQSGAAVMFGGGEKYYLPQGTQGVHGPGVRVDGRNLIQEAEENGYTIVRTRDELLALPADTDKVIGLFAAYHTFNDQTEEDLKAQGLPMYLPDAPTIAEMTEVALRILNAKDQRFLLVIEEEGTDNFGNKNNASGQLEAMRRADDACGVMLRFLDTEPNTMILYASDSDGGGGRMVGIRIKRPEGIPATLPARDRNGAPMDGIHGTGTAPFMAAPDRNGQQLPFGVVWAGHDDVSGGILVRAAGLNAKLVQGVVDNTEITHLMRRTLFGKAMP